MAFVSCKQVVAAACDKSAQSKKNYNRERILGLASPLVCMGGGCLAACLGGLVVVSYMSPSFCHEVNIHVYKTTEAVTAGLMCYGGGKGRPQSTKLG